jgi:polysaccharide export outer membrane protein
MRIFWVFATLVAMLQIVMAQQTATYRLQAEDVIRIQVYRELDINATLPVGKDGFISAPFVGPVKAAGKTTFELEKDLRDLYISKVKLNDPIVSVTIEAFRVLRATVSGFIGRPGVYPIRQGDTIQTLLAQGGSVPTDGSANLRRATLRRAATNELIPIDLESLIIRGDLSQNYVLEDGDELIIPQENRNRVNVIGQVRNAGQFQYREQMRVLDAVTLAGGEIPYRSRFSRIQVIRELPGRAGDYLSIEVDLVRFYNRGDAKQNILLKPGDIVYIPDSGNADFNQIGTVANLLFILERFGINPFRF